ncbi:Transient receptor potential cation channel subfamily M member 6, partial [Paramuricea clavata]
MENQEKWRRYEDKIKAKRDINTNRKKKPNEVRKLRRDELVMQRLSATVSGKAQKFSRIGAREFVPYPLDDLTVRGIKDACLSHFGQRVSGMECDILAGEQGPSCKTLEQITDLNKVIHIRFVSCDKEIVPVQDDEASGNEDSHSFTLPAKKKPKVGKKFDSFVPPSYRPSSLPTVATVMPEVPVEEKAVYPKSLSISQILKLGKLVKPPPERKSTVKCIQDDLHTTVENQAKKSIQVHYPAKNFAEQMHSRVQEICRADYGETFFYSDVYLGKDENNKVVTVEEFVEGEFSGGKIMLVDLQGSGYHLFDPEIASRDVIEGDEYLFSTGNLSGVAINYFTEQHKCNAYCEAVGLLPFKQHFFG